MILDRALCLIFGHVWRWRTANNHYFRECAQCEKIKIVP
jgi:hypothetical protein